jgi:predicted  nucleic acid-binding Zn-ribbon protein
VPALRLSPRRLVAAAAALVALAAGCSDDEDPIAALRTDLDAATTATEQLQDQVTTLEAQLADLLVDPEPEGDTEEDPLQTLTDALDALAARLEVLDTELANETVAREQAAKDATDAATDIRRTLDRVRAAVDGLSGEVDELRVLYETLRDRLDNHTH